MPEIPPGAQVSEDGKYWWDGTEWQLVEESPPEGGTYVQFENYLSWWDSSQTEGVDPELVESATRIQQMIDADSELQEFLAMDFEALKESSGD